MRIGIEAQRIFREKKHGMDIYALELIRQLQQIDLINEYYIFVKDGPDVCLKETANFTIFKLKGLTYADWEQWSLPKAAWQYQLDVLHCTSNTAPLFCPVPLLLTLHDIIYLEKGFSGGSTYQALGHYYRKYIVPQVFKKAKKVFTVSYFEKSNISHELGSSKKVEVIYNGVSSSFRPVDSSRLKARLGLPEQYLLFHGNTAPKKNMSRLLEAYYQYRLKQKCPLKLVVTETNHDELDELLRKSGIEAIREHVHLTGYVNHVELPELYSGASAFLYPSLRESFGIPIIEALACNTAVVTSRTSAMPEIAGHTAVLVDPFSVQSITEGIITALRRQNVPSFLARIKKFDWSITANKTLKQYGLIESPYPATVI